MSLYTYICLMKTLYRLVSHRKKCEVLSKGLMIKYYPLIAKEKM